MKDYVAPTIDKNAFNCPHCNAFSNQKFHDIYGSIVYGNNSRGPFREIECYMISKCDSCDNYSIWFEGKLIYPKSSIAPLPIKEMPEDVKEDFNEARMIVNESPRGAAALLRLALEKLLPQVGAEEGTIDQMIGYLVKEKNLPAQIQRALDSLRVIGNEAVHPGELNLKDDTETALALFRVLNVIIHTMIIQPKEINDLYEMIPEMKKEGIKNRDKKT